MKLYYKLKVPLGVYNNNSLIQLKTICLKPIRPVPTPPPPLLFKPCCKTSFLNSHMPKNPLHQSLRRFPKNLKPP